MTQPRKRLVSYSDTVYYHCLARCVRRAFLCGKDPLTGYDFEHRRQWIVDRLHKLSSVFAIELCAYVVINNHYHVVLRVNLERAETWTDEEVVARWCQLFSGPGSVQRWMKGLALETAERDQVQQTIQLWRRRLKDLSWFMRCLNESIARMANQEDRCSGKKSEDTHDMLPKTYDLRVLECRYRVIIHINTTRNAGLTPTRPNPMG